MGATIIIRGVQPGQYKEVLQILGGQHPHQGPKYLFVNFTFRAAADLAVVALNNLAGVKAEIDGDRKTS